MFISLTLRNIVENDGQFYSVSQTTFCRLFSNSDISIMLAKGLRTQNCTCMLVYCRFSAETSSFCTYAYSCMHVCCHACTVCVDRTSDVLHITLIKSTKFKTTNVFFNLRRAQTDANLS